MTFRKLAGILTVVAALIPLGVVVLGGCGPNNSARTEARELFDRISALDPNASEGVRRARVAHLADLALHQPELVEVQGVCLTAHRGLLDAEDEQAQARTALDAAEGKHAGGGIPAADAEQIAAAIDRSNRALARAQEALPRCEAQSRQLALGAR